MNRFKQDMGCILVLIGVAGVLGLIFWAAEQAGVKLDFLKHIRG